MGTRLLVVTLVAALFGCSSDATEPEPGVLRQNNACQTPNAFYLMICVEYPNGTCGPLPEQLVGGAATGGPIYCDSGSTSGCTTKATKCRTGDEDCDVKTTYTIEFEADGSRADATMTIEMTCHDGDYCLSTYDCGMTRQ